MKINITFSFLIILLLNQLLLSQSGWVQLNSGTNSELYTICMVDSEVGYVGGTNGLFLKTTNGGINWVNLQMQISFSYPLLFLNRDIGFFLISNKIFRTSDGGLNWNELSSFQYNLNEIIHANGDTLFVRARGSSPYPPYLPVVYLYKSINWGQSWSLLFSRIGMSGGLSFINGITGFLNVDGVIEKTNNGGNNWVYSILPNSYNSTSFMQFLNLNTGIIIAYNPNIQRYDLFKTTDGCNTWHLSADTSTSCVTAFFVSPQNGYIISSRHDIFMTVNGGLNWQQQQVNLGNYDYLHRFFFVNQNTGYSIGSNGIILKTTNGGQPIGIGLINEQEPVKYSLSQNYPNPFNPTTNIKFDLPKAEFVKLTIYDALGREVSTLVNNEMKPGSYNADWDASSFASGIYFYKLSVQPSDRYERSAGYVETKKMVLIK